jgi:hypothetical protein
MIQQAVMKISLKKALPKLVLVSITMSKGGKFLFQEMGMVFQQETLKGQSKKEM